MVEASLPPHTEGVTTPQAGTPCPCGQGVFAACCGRFLEGECDPGSALELMRARYSAYVLGRVAFLQRTWHPATCPAVLDAADLATPRWLGLEIRAVKTPDEHSASVEFVARYRVGGRGFRLHERSHFERLAGRWTYREGEMLK
jgi:SEC-C motif-containing protein